MYFRPLATPLIYTGISFCGSISAKAAYERNSFCFWVHLHKVQYGSVFAPRQDKSWNGTRESRVPCKTIKPYDILVTEGIPQLGLPCDPLELCTDSCVTLHTNARGMDRTYPFELRYVPRVAGGVGTSYDLYSNLDKAQTVLAQAFGTQ
jgi:hypothetical protein